MAVLNKLTDKTVKAAKPRDKMYTLADGGGLVLQVTPEGSKRWRLRYRFHGVPKMLSMGTYPDTTLSLARDKRDKARQQLAEGVDPSVKRQAEREAHADTFEALAREFMAQSDRDEGTLETMRRRLELHVFPRIGKKPIVQVTTQELLRALRRVEQRGTYETARRIRTNCSQVFRYAIATGRADSDPAAPLVDALKPTKAKKFSFVKGPKAIGQLMRAVDGYEGHPVTVAALKLAPMLLVRPGELRAAEWSEFDLDAALWRIPAARMKMKREHLVPLPPQAVEILRDLYPLTGEGGQRYVFPSGRTTARPMSNNALTSAFRRMGYSKDELHWHGLRHMASTELHELGYDTMHIERQLAHVDQNKIRGTYNAAEYYPARAAMLKEWASYLDKLRDPEAAEKLEAERQHKALHGLPEPAEVPTGPVEVVTLPTELTA